MVDKFNAVENSLKTFLAADTAIAAQVNLFHVKLRDDIAQYANHELPAVAVHSFGYGEGEDDYFPVINCLVEIINRGGDLDTVDGKVKEIASLAINALRLESPLRGGKGFSGSVESIDVSEALIDFAVDESVYTVFAGIRVNVGLVEK